MSLSHSSSSHVVQAAITEAQYNVDQAAPSSSASSSSSPSQSSSSRTIPYHSKFLNLSRKQQLEAMSNKRRGNFTYLQKVHNGDAYWLNCVLLSKDFLRYYTTESVPTQRTLGYYYLGLGLSNILKLSAGAPTVKAFSQLMEEYEYYMSSAMMQSVKYVAAKTATSPYGVPTSIRTHSSSSPEASGGIDSAAPSRDTSLQDPSALLGALEDEVPDVSDSAPVSNNDANNCNNNQSDINDNGGNIASNSNSLYKFNGDVLFQYFVTPVVPIELHYPEVVSALAEILGEVYEKLVHEDCYCNANLFEIIVRLDGRVKSHFVSLIAKEFTEIALKKSTEGISQLRNSNLDFY